ncbi:UvrD-helicase domain-containing protein [Pseudobacteroides cellulosolvens]|uniref:DNA 3'-5' helicase n=1 Tax=Pseudobacteroides cellulosolvens ATCC 35603 = DSM 2933 TaxID=398512 RepID=A0A0L6JSG0_9FIRM|nr:UvrD-helicase domain-containing protein [Pseudobacteroides cellulosolvens]KNY28665.1 Helicase superfamily 1 UvrD-related protein [Pseudobacteroides cellulosolvens ATCC 35603 = DSM 2933]
MDFTSILRDKYNIDLNEQQAEAVNNIHGPALLLSVPGGGKTTVIVSRVANMILNHNIDPGKILTLTFSRASASDMKNRFKKIFGNDIVSDVQFSTIHSFCYSVIDAYVRGTGKPFPKVIEGSENEQSKAYLLKKIYLEVNNEYINEDTLEDLSSTISYVKNMLMDLKEIEELETSMENFPDIYNAYEKYKREARLIDYDDMLTGTYMLFKQNKEMLNIFRNKYHYINVDESQDTSFAQHELIKLMASPKNNIFMVGDEDQSIYGFRAAFPQALLDFDKTYTGAKIMLMERNYRSTECIVKPANMFIKQNRDRFDKNMFTEKEKGNTIEFVSLKDRNSQYDHILNSVKKFGNSSQCAVLYRNNISAIPLVEFFDRNGVSFYLKETNIHFFKHWMVTDILSFIKLGLNLLDTNSFTQIYYKMNVFLSKEMIQYVLSNIGEYRDIFDALMSYPGINQRTRRELAEIYKDIKRMTALKPFDAIEFIEKDLNYKLFIRKMCKEKGYSQESLNQVMDALKTISEKCKTYDDFFRRLEHLQEVIGNSKNNRYGHSVILSTIHSSKGLEFDNVFIIDLIEGQFPTAKSISDCDEGDRLLMEEEVRLFYVGMTRARKHLEIITFDTSNKRKVPVSRFVKQLLKAQRTANFHKTSIGGNKLKKSGVPEDIAGAMVEHIKFGVGEVIYTDKHKGTMKVKFHDVGDKILAVNTCIEEGLIKVLEESRSTHQVIENNSLDAYSIEELRELALEIGNTGKTRQLLTELFWHEDYEVRRRACSAASKLKDSEVTKSIVPCLYAPEPQIRQYALKAVLKSKCKDMVHHVKKVLENEDKYYNIDLCQKILDKL